MANSIKLVFAALVALIVLASVTLFTVDQRQYAIVFQLGEIKQVMIDTVYPFVKEHQERRAQVTDDMVRAFMTPRVLTFN